MSADYIQTFEFWCHVCTYGITLCHHITIIRTACCFCTIYCNNIVTTSRHFWWNDLEIHSVITGNCKQEVLSLSLKRNGSQFSAIISLSGTGDELSIDEQGCVPENTAGTKPLKWTIIIFLPSQ